MSATVLVKGAHLVDPANRLDAPRDLLVVDGKVGAVAEPGARLSAPPGATVIDAAGLHLFPGFIDLHVHLREPGEESKENIETGTKAAVAGGFTAVVAMPNTRPVNDSAEVTALIRERAARVGQCRVYPSGAVTKGQKGEELAEMRALVEAGCVCLTDDGHPIMNAGLMRNALKWAKPIGVPIMAHEEDLHLSRRAAMHEGAVSTRLGLSGYPASAEVVMVARDLELLEETGGRLHLGHLSCEGSVRLVREAKRRGLPVTCEVTPHHFALTDVAVGRYDTHAKMNPPLRDARHAEAIREALADGTVDAIATDHAPHGPGDKQVEFERAMNGVVGLETALPLSLELVERGLIPLSRMVELLSWGPARAFRLPGGKLSVGEPADFLICDLSAGWKVDSARFFSKSRNTPFHGRAVKGRVRRTFVGGVEKFAQLGGTEESR